MAIEQREGGVSAVPLALAGHNPSWTPREPFVPAPPLKPTRYQREVAARVREGVCPKCAGPRVNTARVICEACRERQARYEAGRRERAKRLDEIYAGVAQNA